MVKILGISGSPKKGATEYCMEQALEAAAAFDPRIEVDLITVRGKKITPCIDCNRCREDQSWCILKDDVQPLLDKIMEADGFIIGSPVYAMTASPQLTALMSRLKPLSHCRPGVLRNKFCCAIAVGGTRNGGQELTISTIVNLMAARQVNFVSNEQREYIGGRVWSQDGGAQGAAQDEAGMRSVRAVGKKLAEVCLIYSLGRAQLQLEQEKEV